MHISDFTGRGASVKGLCEAFQVGAPAHATLLIGPDGVGKRALAHTLVKSLFCTGEGERPCGECPGCRKYEAGSHPDVHITPAQKRIGVDAIRELIATLSVAPYEGGWRAAIIEDAGTMTTQAQNSLLKTLEEPPPRTVFILTATSAAQLLATVRSRCLIVQVPPLAQVRIEAILCGEGMEPGRAAQLAAMAQGSVGRARQMDTDGTFWALRTRVYDALAAVRTPGDVLMAVNTLRDDKTDALRVCDLLETALQDALHTGFSGASPVETTPWIQALTALDARTLTTLLTKVMRMRQMLASNVAWQAVLERFLLEYTEEIM